MNFEMLLADEGVGEIVATVEGELTLRVIALEDAVEELRTSFAAMQTSFAASLAELKEITVAPVVASAEASAGRKTLPTQMTAMLSKQGVSIVDVEAGSLDGALSSLSIEQRIAVKSQMLRSGLLG